MPVWIASASKNVGGSLWNSLYNFIDLVVTVMWDNGLFLLNLILPGRIVRATKWPPYEPRKETDSRSPCPALNALAAHGLLPRDGRNIKFTELAEKVNVHFNCAPSFCYFVCNFLARILHRDYGRDTLDLSDMNVHNGIEHDGSFTRFDAYKQPDQGIPAEELILETLAASKDGKKMTPADYSRVLSTRWAHSKATNPQFSLDSFHKYFGASNAAVTLKVIGNDVNAIKSFYLDERIPDGWKPNVRSRMGLTMAQFNGTSLRILLGIDQTWQKTKLASSD